MPGPQPPLIQLTADDRQGIEKLIRQHRLAQQKALRARIVLLAADGKNNPEIVHELKISLDMVRLWRRRWLDLQAISREDLSLEERLEDLPRPGAPARVTANQMCKIEQLACEQPEKAGRPISQWTSREIADEIVQRGILDTISARHAARLLKKKVSNRT